ncbi:MAG: VacJ family lipoprotein, partial [Alphaproteobacteria bacterium]|nr:VacJ family lipoprotein [Alphaproteobacteria bacterium]
GTLSVVDLRAQNLGTLESIERTSVDYYATTRNLYLQYRAAQIRKGKPDVENLPNF